MNRNGIKYNQPFRQRQSVLNKVSIQIFEIGKTYQLRDIRIVADIPIFFGIGVPPLFGCHSEKGHIKNIRFAGIDQIDLGIRQRSRYQVSFDSLRVVDSIPVSAGAASLWVSSFADNGALYDSDDHTF